MTRLRFGLALFLLIALVAPFRHAAAEGERIALVVGIGAYETVPSLPNPPNDAQAMAETLEALGFEVDHRRDLTNRSFATALREFGIRAADAEVAVIYYAGHGVQVNGINYLIPADAHLERERDLVYEALPVSLPLGELAQASKLGILILDACRNNPFVDRLSQSSGSNLHVGAGLARVDDTPSDTMVAMATRANQVAEDGQGRHSPFTDALLRHLDTPGLELSLFFREVRDSVKEATNSRQEPFIYGSLGAEPFYFNPLPPNRAPALAAMQAVEVFDRGGPVPLRIGRPTDPDDDQLVAQVTALPKGGSIRVGDRLVLIGDYLTVEQLAAAAFVPDASHVGDADGFGFAVMDGRGGISRGTVAIAIKPSNTPPVVPAERRLVVAAMPLYVDPPTDPDGDPLTVEIVAVPEHGHVLDGIVPVAEGDRIAPEALLRLSYDPTGAPAGPAGSLSIAVEDGRGGRSTSSVVVEVAEPGSMTAAPDPEDAVWQDVVRTGTPDAYGAFLTLFPDGRHTDEARRRLAELAPVVAETPPEASGETPPVAEVSIEVEAAPVEPEQGPEPEPERFVAITTSNVRADPDTGAPRIGTIENGVEVEVVGKADGTNWYKVTLADGNEGFVYAPLLRPVEGEIEDEVEAGDEPMPADPSSDAGEQDVAAVLPAPEPALRNHGNANSFRDCPDCPVMVRVPPGEFTMGDDKGHRSHGPARQVTIAKPFAAGTYEVTVDEWRTCVADGGCADIPSLVSLPGDRPVHNASRVDAESFATWLSQKTGQRYRLPTEAEWEYAARAGSGGSHWWGADPAQASCRDCGGPWERLVPVSVASFDANPFGFHDMSGGVAEWVADCWYDDYEGAPRDQQARTQDNCRMGVLRGGSWRDDLANTTTTTRIGYDVGVRYLANGFRIARDLN